MAKVSAVPIRVPAATLTLRWAFGVQQPLKAAQPAPRSGGWIATASKGETASSGPRISRLPMIATRCGEACGTA